MNRKNTTMLSVILSAWSNGLIMHNDNKLNIGAAPAFMKSIRRCVCVFITLVFNHIGLVQASNLVSTLTLSPSSPNGTYSMSWQYNPYSVAEGLATANVGYLVKLQKSSNNVAWQDVPGTSSSSQTYYSVAGAPEGTYYYRLVRAFQSGNGPGEDGGGPSGGTVFEAVAEVAKSITVAFPPPPLCTPQNLTVAGLVSGSFPITWDVVTPSSSCRQPDRYELEEQKIGANGYGYVQVYSGLNNQTSRNHTSNELYYRVRSCQSSACSGWSGAVNTRAIQTPSPISYVSIGNVGVGQPGVSHVSPFFSNGNYDVTYGSSANQGPGEAEVSYFKIQEIFNNQPNGLPILKLNTVVEVEPYDRVELRNKAPGVYTYAVQACNELHLCSTPVSPAYPATVLAVPNAPANVSLSPQQSKGGLTLKWDHSTGPMGNPMVTEYQISEVKEGIPDLYQKRGDSNDYATVRVTDETGDILLITQISANANGFEASFTRNVGIYKFQIRGCNLSGCGEFSPFTPEAQATVIPPGSPDWFIVESDKVIGNDQDHGSLVYGDDGDDFTVQWAAVDEIPNVPVIYYLEETGPGGETIDEITTVSINGAGVRIAEKNFTGKAYGEYSYRVIACMDLPIDPDGYQGQINPDSCGDWTQEATLLIVSRPANAPENFTGVADQSSGTVSLSWDAVQNASYYEIDQKTDGGEWALLDNSSGATSRSINTHVSGSASYQYRIRACNGDQAGGLITFCEGNPNDTLYFAFDTGYTIDTPQQPSAELVPPPSDAEDTIGSTKGMFRVNESGAATYDVDIAAAAGTAGVAPQLSLRYTSQAGNGLVGLGWRIGGLSSIHRCRQTLVQDNGFKPITWGAQDRFCYDGQRLLLQNGGTYGAVGSTYRTEIDNFATITAVGGSAGSPNYFEVKRKDGSTSYYGLTSNSKESYPSGVKTWAVEQIQDSVENKIKFVYANDVATGFRISHVDYAYGNSGSPQASIKFNYENRSDDLRYYVAGEPVVTSTRLKSVESENQNVVLRKYTLDYEQSSQNNAASRVKSIQECTAGNICLPKTTFDWQIASNLHSADAFAASTIDLDLGEDIKNQYLVDSTFADINGDDQPDIIYISSHIQVKKRFLSAPKTQSHQRVHTLLSTPNGYVEAFEKYYPDSYEKPVKIKAIDYNLDGRQDLLIKSEFSNWELYLSQADGQGSWNLQSTNIALPFTSDDTQFIDVNGDGLTDAVDGKHYWLMQRRPGAALSSNQYYQFSSTQRTVNIDPNLQWGVDNLADELRGGNNSNSEHEYFNPSFRTIKGSAGDINGDGLGDFLMKKNGYQVGINQLNGASITIVEAPGAPSISDHTLLRFADINADGLTDLVYWSENHKYWITHLSYGDTFGPGILMGETAVADADAAADQDLKVADVDNDGFLDVVWQQGAELKVRYWYNATGTFSAVQKYRDIFDPENPPINPLLSPDGYKESHIIGDFTGDGFSDYLVFRTNEHSASVSFAPSGDLAGAGGNEANRNLNNVVSRITNGLGATTVIAYERLNQSAAHSPLEPLSNDYTDLNNPFAIPAGSDAIQTSPRTPVLPYESPLPIVTAVSSSAPTMDNPAAMSSLSYRYQKASLQAGGRGNLGFRALQTIDRQTWVTTTTRYRQDWPFIGHPSVTEVRTPSNHLLSRSSNIWKIKGWNSNWPSNASNSGTASLGSIQPFIATSVEEGYALSDNGASQGDRLSEVTTTNQHDDYGNPTQLQIVTKGLDDGVGFSLLSTQTTVNEYGSTGYDEEMGRLSHSSVTTSRPGKPALQRESSFTYFTGGGLKGLLKTETVQPNGNDSQKLVTEHFYDNFGNKTQAKTTGWDGVANVTRLGTLTKYDGAGRYADETYQTFPGIGERRLTSVRSRNAYGTPTEIEDVNGNRAYTAFSKMGREYFATSDAGGWTRLSLATSDTLCPSGTKTVVSSLSADGGRAKECFDVLGRSVRKLGIIFNAPDGGGTQMNWVATDTAYDSQGRVVQQSVPFTIVNGYGTGEYQTTNEYDLVGNVITLTTPGGNSSNAFSGSSYGVPTTMSYNGLSTVTTNVAGQVKTEVKNALGDVVRVTDDAGATTHYGYDSLGNLLTMTDAFNNTTTIIYDELGRKISMSDPDKGDWTYQYNAFGELIKQTDGKGQIVKSTFDSLGREIRRTDFAGGDTEDCIVGVTVWTYDSQLYGLGLLAKVRASDGYQQVSVYDSFGRVIQTNTTVPGAGVYETAQTYDHLGRPFQSFDASSKTSTPGVTVHQANGVRGTQTVYNEYGFVSEVQDVRKANGVPLGFYQRNTQMDERGNVSKYVLGNGVEVTKTYYSPTGLIHGIHAQRPLFNTTIQELLYYWDDLGNLSGRTTRGELGQDIVETFTYDNINRLDTSYVDFDGQSNVVDVDYDLIGNIKHKSDVGDYTYGDNGAGPHAVSKAGDARYHYDNNGNNYYGDGRTIKYSTFDKPVEISRGTHTTAFSYDPARSRYKRVDHDSATGNAKTTFYLGNVELIQHTGGDRAGEVEYKRQLGVAVETLSYDSAGRFEKDERDFLLHDHLGSVERIISDRIATNDLDDSFNPDNNVRIIQKMSFDPWGQRRDVSTVSPLYGQALAEFDSSITTRGYTGHEMVDGVGIIHMNGRIFDPKIGRFLQADPIIQAPFDTQSLNRYSYVRNNPLNATDPTGYVAESLLYFAAIAVGTYVVTDFLVTHGFDDLAQFASLAGCAATGNAAGCAGASAGSTYAFTYDFGKAARSAATSYLARPLYGEVSEVGKAGGLLNSVSNGLVGGVLSGAAGVTSAAAAIRSGQLMESVDGKWTVPETGRTHHFNPKTGRIFQGNQNTSRRIDVVFRVQSHARVLAVGGNAVGGLGVLSSGIDLYNNRTFENLADFAINVGTLTGGYLRASFGLGYSVGGLLNDFTGRRASMWVTDGICGLSGNC